MSLKTTWTQTEEREFIRGFTYEIESRNNSLEKQAILGAALRGLGKVKTLLGTAPSVVGTAAKSTKTYLKDLSSVSARGVANLPGRVAAAIPKAIKGSLVRSTSGRRVGGSFSKAKHLAKDLSTEGLTITEELASQAKNLKPGETKHLFNSAGKKVSVYKDRLGNIYDMSSPETTHGVVDVVKGLVTPSGWKRSIQESFKPATKFMGVNVTNAPVPVRRGLNFLKEEINPLALAGSGLEYSMAQTPEEKREVFTRSIPAGYLASMIQNTAGKKVGLGAQIGSYIAADYLVGKIPGSTAKRWGGRTESQVDSIAKQYDVSPDQVKAYLENMGKENQS